MDNPFACFSCEDSVGTGSGGRVDAVPRHQVCAPEPPTVRAPPTAHGLKRKRTDRDTARVRPQKSEAGVAFMLQWWHDLRELTSNYPFAVMVTGVLGAQARDVVSVAAMRRVATRADGDICPEKLARFDVDSFEEIIRTVNHCRKKSKTIIDLSKLIKRRAMPSTRIGLCQLPGVGPKISDIVMEIAYGAPRAGGSIVAETNQLIIPGLIPQRPECSADLGAESHAHVCQEDIIEVLDCGLPYKGTAPDGSSIVYILDSDGREDSSRSPNSESCMGHASCLAGVCPLRNGTKENRGDDWSDSGDDIWTIPTKNGRIR